MNNRVTVVGSYNVGLFLKGEAIPKGGETLIGQTFYESGGGKGSNQAVAAQKMGAQTVFIGRIGKDRYGLDALAMYERLGIATSAIQIDGQAHTGVSVILIDKNGQNSIMVVPGSNYNLSVQDMDDAAKRFAQSDIVGFQLENNLETVCHGIRRAHEAGARVLLDPAPAAPLPEGIYPCLTYIKPNELEAAAITGIPVTDEESARRAGEWLVQKGVENAIITLGERGAVLVNAQGTRHFKTPALPGPVLDTTGAGDCFSGTLMAALAQGQALDSAIRRAICASALSTTRLGVIEAIPERDEVEAMLQSGGGRVK